MSVYSDRDLGRDTVVNDWCSVLPGNVIGTHAAAVDDNHAHGLQQSVYPESAARGANTPVRKIDNNRRTGRAFGCFFRRNLAFPPRHGRCPENGDERAGVDAIISTKTAQHWPRRPRFLAERGRDEVVCRSAGRSIYI